MNQKIIKNTKSQFLIFSGLFFILLLIFFYSLGTENSYITKKSKFNLLDNIIYETCEIGKNSNGSLIDQRYSNFTLNIENYCLEYNYNCSLSIINNSQIPPNGNWSLLNYTHYNYSIYYYFEGFEYSGDFTC